MPRLRPAPTLLRAAPERDFLFSAPPDPKLDRDGYFERCWPGAGWGQNFDFVRLIESGEEVVVTYQARFPAAAGHGTPRSSPSTTTTRSPRTEVSFDWNLD
jgi:hypothetical protein